MSTIGPPGQRLTFSQLEALWTQNGGNPMAAPIMAAIALAESGGLTNNLNDTPSTGDYSVGLWQINYYGALANGRSAQYGTPAQLAADPNLQARAAISISGNGTNLKPWTTYTSGAASKVLRANGGAFGPIPVTPAVGPAAATGAPNTGSVDGEGNLFDFKGTSVAGQTILPGLSLQRATVRKILGFGVIGGGVVIGVAGLFLLAGRKAPGPSKIVQEVVRSRTAKAREATRQEGITQRADMAAQRKRQAEAESVAGLGDRSGGDL